MMQEQQLGMDDPNGFFHNFMKFYTTAKEVTNVRFSYMKELYNLCVDSFPENEDVFNIQQNNRLSSQAFQSKMKKNWTDDDKKVLIWLVGKVLAMNKRDLKQISDADWNLISGMMHRRDAFQCKQKWMQMLKLPLQQAPWTAQEDELLRKIIDDFQRTSKGNKWSLIATTVNKQNDSNVYRNGKQCRERWNNHLNPSINRNPWQLQEDLDLMKLSIQNGKKWALISKKLEFPRSENSVKNRFNCLLRKERNVKQKNEEISQDEEDSRMSNYPSSAEELSQSDIRYIHTIIKKLEWRLQQDNMREGDDKPQIKVKQEHQEIIIKKQKIEQLTKKQQQRQSNEIVTHQLKSQESIINPGQLLLTIKDAQHILEEEVGCLIPCLLNRQKNTVYLTSQDQMQQFLVKLPEYMCNQQQQNQQVNHEINISNHGSYPSYFGYYDNKYFNQGQFQMMPPGVEYAHNMTNMIPQIHQQMNSQVNPQSRSIINLPSSITNYGPMNTMANFSCFNQGYQASQLNLPSYATGLLSLSNQPSTNNLLNQQIQVPASQILQQQQQQSKPKQ